MGTSGIVDDRPRRPTRQAPDVAQPVVEEQQSSLLPAWAEATRRADIFFDASRRLRTQDLPPIDRVPVMTDEYPDSFGDETGLSAANQAELIDMLPDDWDDLCHTLKIAWGSVPHRAIASITKECMARAVAEQALAAHTESASATDKDF